MVTISENLIALQTAKESIKTAITNKGQDLTDVPFTEYGSKIEAIQTGGGEDMLQARVDATNSCSYLFYKYTGNNVDFISKLNTSNVNDFSYMFASASKITSVPRFDISNATSLAYLFSGCSKLKTFIGYDTSKVTNMGGILYNCIALETAELNLINATTIDNLVFSCKALTNLTLKNIKKGIRIGLNAQFGTLLTLDSLINTIKELWDYSSETTTYTLTISTTSKELIADVYVKLIDVTEEMLANDPYADQKMPCEVCESTDEGAMLITDYATLKRWSIS